MPGRHVLDTFALTAMIFSEPAAQQVRDALDDDTNILFMSTISLGEVFYVVRRRLGDAVARQATVAAFSQPNLTIIDATWPRILAAAEIKAGGRISYADAFAAALAREQSAALMTGDPEFARLEQRGLIQVEWLPQR